MSDKIEQTRARIAKYSKIKGFIETGTAIIKNPTIINSEKRLKVCKKCKYLKGNRCSVCGCFMFIKAKFQASKCPKGYWSDSS